MATGVVLACGQRIWDFVIAVAWTIKSLFQASSSIVIRDILNQ